MHHTTTAPAPCLQRRPGDALLGAMAAGLDSLSLARIVTVHVRKSGKHFLPATLLTSLNEIRRRDAGRDPLLDAFLHCALDKHDGRFWNRTYLALPVLERLSAGQRPERIAALLVADIARFEAAAIDDGHMVSDLGRPDPATARKRIRHALRFIAALGEIPAGAVDETDLSVLPAATGLLGEWLPVTVHPVDTVHDEYFFIRVLQAHEFVFTAIADRLREGIDALRDGSPVRAADAVDAGRKLLDAAGALFRIAATMRPAAFLRFRDYTQGASAIQSEQYKRFEILCGRPRLARADSAAFSNVPAVRAEIDAGQDSLTEAFLDTRENGPTWSRMERSFAELESSHQRWKTAHHSLASRMLGDATGSGYTSGVPYLRKNLENRLFWQVGGCPVAH